VSIKWLNVGGVKLNEIEAEMKSRRKDRERKNLQRGAGVMASWPKALQRHGGWWQPAASGLLLINGAAARKPPWRRSQRNGQQSNRRLALAAAASHAESWPTEMAGANESSVISVISRRQRNQLMKAIINGAVAGS